MELQQNALQNLPPELQARIQGIMAGNNNAAETPAPVVSNAPQERQVARPPSVLDHLVALRQEVAHLNNQVAAQGQVIEAVGNAVGQMYQMFQPTQQPNQGPTYSETFQQSVEDDY